MEKGSVMVFHSVPTPLTILPRVLNASVLALIAVPLKSPLPQSGQLGPGCVSLFKNSNQMGGAVPEPD